MKLAFHTPKGHYPFRNGMEERSHFNDVTGMLVFGKEENENPPDWLAGYVNSLPPTKHEIKREQADTRENNGK